MSYVKLIGENNMFTGIIDQCGLIQDIKSLPNASRIWIKSNFTDLVLGESISIDGICLTVTEINATQFSCDISPETLKVTTAKYFQQSQFVNLERAMLLSSRLGGHMVSGHVDQVCSVQEIKKHNEFTEIIFNNIDPLDMSLLNKKGSITVNGVSLTINEVTSNTFSVMLIPHTLEITNLSDLRVSSLVNIEFDMIARIIVNQFQKYISSSDEN